LDFVITHGGATVAQLSAELGLADATVRRHLDRLAAEGLVSDRSVRQTTGRPYRLYSGTDAGVRSQRDHSAALAERLIAQITNEPAPLATIVQGIAAQVVAAHRQDVPADAPLEQRVAKTVEALRGEGILDDWTRRGGSYILHTHGCPYRSAADSSDCICESDRLAIEQLIGVEVEQVGSLARGDKACEFIVSMPQGQAGLPDSPQQEGSCA
jgi:predicted ArsR family transcriptional regulator